MKHTKEHDDSVIRASAVLFRRMLPRETPVNEVDPVEEVLNAAVTADRDGDSSWRRPRPRTSRSFRPDSAS